MNATPSTPPAADSLSPTSGLPFAARHCDAPYLDSLFSPENRRYEAAKSAPDNVFAIHVAQFINRADQVGELLAVVDEYLKAAHRGGANGVSAIVVFSRAMAMLVVARELVERSVLDADEAHENYCKPSA